MSVPVLEAVGLTVVYPTGRGRVTRVLDRFTLSIEPREIVGLVGESGSGKSTAALALQGLVRHPGRFDAGKVLFEGRNLLSLPETELRRIRGRDIGMITQKPRQSLNPMLRVGHQISNVYRAHNRVGSDEGKRRAVEMLRTVGINDAERRAGAYPHELSGGMAQRALIAMALSSRPKLLIADEPTSGLDVTIQAQFLDEMWTTVQQTGSAVLLVTQDLGIIANYCDRVVVLQNGQTIESAPVRVFFKAPEHPYSQKILGLQRAEPQQPSVDPEPGAPALLQVAGLKKTFELEGSKDVLQAVSDVSFEIRPGRTLGLVGESGSGKTTVGRMLLRLVEPTAGSISFRGREIHDISSAEFRALRSKLQIVFQDPFDSLNPRWTVRRLLREPLDLHTDLDPAAKDGRVSELLSMVGLDAQTGNLKTRQLSAGQQQRVCVARALATGPEFIVLDEPTSALPPAARAEIIDLLIDLQRRLGVGYLFISHDLTTVEYLCHDVAVMYLSQIVESGSRQQVFGDPQHPYSRALLSSHLFPDPTNRRIDREVDAALSGEIPSPINLPVGCYLATRCPMAVEDCHTSPQKLVDVGDGRRVRCWRITEKDLVWNDNRSGD